MKQFTLGTLTFEDFCLMEDGEPANDNDDEDGPDPYDCDSLRAFHRSAAKEVA